MAHTLFDEVMLRVPYRAPEVDAHFQPTGGQREIFPGERLDVLNFDAATGLYVLEHATGNFYEVPDSFVQ